MTLPGGNIGLRLPAPRQAHSPSGHNDIYGYGSNFAVISPPLIRAHAGRRCPHFVLKWRYAEVCTSVPETLAFPIGAFSFPKNKKPRSCCGAAFK